MLLSLAFCYSDARHGRYRFLSLVPGTPDRGGAYQNKQTPVWTKRADLGLLSTTNTDGAVSLSLPAAFWCLSFGVGLGLLFLRSFLPQVPPSGSPVFSFCSPRGGGAHVVCGKRTLPSPPLVFLFWSPVARGRKNRRGSRGSSVASIWS